MQDFRCDRATIKHWNKTPEGFLQFVAPVGKVGWLRYANADGTIRREYVSEKVLKDAADSLKIKPVTTPGHPPGLVNRDTVRPYISGSTGNTTWMNSDWLWINGAVFDGATIDSIESGETYELSLGYGVDVIPRADGQGFDQVSRYHNHLSPVRKARAEGAGFKFDGDEEGTLFSLDSIGAELSEDDVTAAIAARPISTTAIDVAKEELEKLSTKEKPMVYKATLDGVDLEFEAMDDAKHVRSAEKELSKLRSDSTSLTAKLDSATLALDEAKTELGTIKAEVATQKTALDEAIATVETTKSESMDGDAIAGLIGDRMKLWQEVLPFLRSDNADFEPDYALTPLEIMTQAVKVANPDLKGHLDGLDLADSENSGFVKGLYAGLNAKQFSTKSFTRANADSLLETIRNGRMDMAGKMGGVKGGMESEKELEEAKKRSADRIANANKRSK